MYCRLVRRSAELAECLERVIGPPGEGGGDYVEFTRGPVPSMTDDRSTPLNPFVFCGVSDGGEGLNTFDFP